MRYPQFLQSNGTIGFVAPSFGCATEPYKTAFLHAQEKWAKEGFHLKFGPNCYADSGIGISNQPDKCGAELTEYYCNETNDCLISCGGGELMCEILDYVDFEKISKAKPKWYMGFSDNTNMTFLLATLCDTAAIYGPCASSFGMEPGHPALQDAMALLQGRKLTMQGYDMWELESIKNEENPLQSYNLTEKTEIKYILPDGRTNIESLSVKGSRQETEGETKPDCEEAQISIDFSGRLLGGCMDCLVNLLGTKYDNVAAFTEKYKDDSVLWFIEACDLNLMSIRRAMWQMEHAGWFKHCSGFLIGRPRIGMGVEEFGIDHYQAVYEMLKNYNVPVMMDVDIGHLPPMMPLICGGMAHVTSDGEKYSVQMELR
ncbi:MAG: LD-carboxypeptidase [Lachnospiraceae bacterium]|nr:LD-carboxypeptidase [Lachnospiraceae bacterium]